MTLLAALVDPAAARVPAPSGTDPGLAAIRASVCGPTQARGAPAGPRLLAGMGDYALPVTGANPLVQRWFNQGLVLAWAFNFGGAQTSMREATRLAPDCAMCWWGLAYVPGPSVNHDLTLEERWAAHEAIERAARLAATGGLTERERGLIAALRLRHADPEQDDRGRAEEAWTAALDRLLRRWGDDADLLTLAAEARMASQGRSYWSRDGRALPGTERILALLEAALRLVPDHPAANHAYVHALEDAPRGQIERARGAADRLARIAPGAGHLLHMPAHIDFRLGRYAEAVAANQNALAADEQSAGDAAYVVGYVDHNRHYLWAAALMAGQGALAREQAALLARGAAQRAPGTQAHWRALPIYTAIRLGDWAAIDALPRPQPHGAYTDGVWRVARGLSHLRAGQLHAAEAELAAARRDHETVARKQVLFKNTHPLAALLGIAVDLLAAEIASVQGEHAAALDLARAAVAAEDALEFDEPPAWHMPARHTLGALLLAAGKPGEAARVYRADLDRHPDNGWALTGLAQALASTDAPGASKARAAAAVAWRRADIHIHASRL